MIKHNPNIVQYFMNVLTSVWGLLVLQNHVFCTPTELTKLILMFVWMNIIMTFLKTLSILTPRMVLFTVVSQDNSIKSKQTKFNWPANHKTYWYYMPLFKKRFLGKNVPYFLCINIAHYVIQWQGTVFPSHKVRIHSDQTKWKHFYFLHPKLVSYKYGT
jgi:hypothetical protein